MSPARRGAGDPKEWLRRARSNLARAEADRGLPEVLFEDLCFDAQQAAEKAIKAVLVHRGVQFPKTHAIAGLLTLAARSGLVVPSEVQDATDLTSYAVETRYPGEWEDVSEEEYRHAIELADRVLRWAQGLIESPS